MERGPGKTLQRISKRQADSPSIHEPDYLRLRPTAVYMIYLRIARESRGFHRILMCESPAVKLHSSQIGFSVVNPGN
jgi:hypothetical protein